MKLSKEIVSHIFSAWCEESGEPLLWNWIKNDGKEPTMERLNADSLKTSNTLTLMISFSPLSNGQLFR